MYAYPRWLLESVNLRDALCSSGPVLVHRAPAHSAAAEHALGAAHEHALRDPFIEDWVEETGRFRIHNLHEMLVVPGVTLGQLGVEMQNRDRRAGHL